MSVVIRPVSFRLITTLSVYFRQLASLHKQEKSHKRHEITKHRNTVSHLTNPPKSLASDNTLGKDT